MGLKKRNSIERALDRPTSRRSAGASSALISRTATRTSSLNARTPLTGTRTSCRSWLSAFCTYRYSTAFVGGGKRGLDSLVKGLILRPSCAVLLRRLFGALGSSVLLGVLRGAGGEGAVAGYGLAHDQGVYVVGALVGVDPFDVGHVLHHAVVEQDAVGPEDVAGCGGDLARLGDVVHLEHRNGCRVEVS